MTITHARSLALFIAAVLLSGCSTITPYTLDLARESPRFGKLSPTEAVAIIRTMVSVSGTMADYRSFVMDEEGFSYKKTSEKTRTEWKKGKAIQKKSTHTLTRNVPWKAIIDIEPYFEEYKAPLLGSGYRIRLRFSVITVTNAQRIKGRETFEISCKTRGDLADVLAALRTVTGK